MFWFMNTACRMQASFYIMYILTNGVMAEGLAFLRVPGAIVYLCLRALSATPAQVHSLN
jgi:hypothetical protein